MRTPVKDSVKTMAWGLIFVFLGCGFCYTLAGNPLHELALIRHGQSTDGSVVGAGEEAQSGDEGATIWSQWVTYRYELPDGREFTRTETGLRRLRKDLRKLDKPVSMQVEYLPGNPAVSRLKGSGTQTVFEWLWRKVLLGAVFLAIALSPGIGILSKGFSDWKATRASPSDLGLAGMPDGFGLGGPSAVSVVWFEGDIMKRIWLPQTIASAMLLWALNPDNPYGYYILLRWVCCVAFAYLAVQAFDQAKQDWVWVLGVVAAVYNPIIPLHLTREIWSFVNVATIIVAVASIFALNRTSAPANS